MTKGHEGKVGPLNKDKGIGAQEETRARGHEGKKVEGVRITSAKWHRNKEVKGAQGQSLYPCATFLVPR